MTIKRVETTIFRNEMSLALLALSISVTCLSANGFTLRGGLNGFGCEVLMATTGASRKYGSVNSNSIFERQSPCVFSNALKRPNKSSATRLNDMTMFNDWESIVFNAESAANDLASLSLQQGSAGSGGIGMGDPTNLITSLPIMYGAGLLTSISPCVWGLLPLTISYISTAAGEREDQKTTLPTIAFAAGLAVVFCTLGITAAQLGGVFGATTTTTTANSGSDLSNIVLPLFSNSICFAMGLQLLGFINLPLISLDGLKSSNRRNKGNQEDLILIDGTGRIISSDKNPKKKGQADESGSLFRTFLLGGSSALVASPCATPVLTSILAFVAKSQNPSLGALLLLVYTLGYSTPLLLVAATGGQALVNLRSGNGSDGNRPSSWFGRIIPWVTPLTGGILLWYGTNGLLTTLFGDPSMAGLVILE